MVAGTPDSGFRAAKRGGLSTSDLLLGAGGAYLLSVPLLWLLAGSSGASAWPMALVWGLSVLVNAPHYGATLLRVYGQRAERRKYALFAVWATGLLLGLFWLGVHDAWVGSALVTAYFSWSPWHFAAQNFGIALLFLRRQGVAVTPATRRLLQASFALSVLLTLLALNAESSNSLPAPTRGGQVPNIDLLRIGIPSDIAAASILASLLAYLLCLAGAGWRLYREAPPQCLLPVGALVLCQAFWFTLPSLALLGGAFDTRSLAFTAIWISAAHSAQYLWVTHHFARQSGEPRRLPAYFGRATLVGNAAFVIPAFLCAPALLGGDLSFDGGLSALVFSLVNLQHFVLDGAVWKLRDGAVTRFLLRGEPAVGPTRPRSAGTSVPLRVMWVVFSLCLVLEAGDLFRQYVQRLGNAQLTGQLLDALSWAGREHEIARIRLGRDLLEQGDYATARRHFARAADAQPSRAAWGGLGRALEGLGDLPAAAQAYEAGLAVDPADAALLRSSGFVHRQLGDLETARKRLAQALQLEPRHARTHRALRDLQRSDEGLPSGKSDPQRKN